MARAFTWSVSNSWQVQNNGSKTWTGELLNMLLECHCVIGRPCSDFMDMLRRLISCRIIIIIIIVFSTRPLVCQSTRPFVICYQTCEDDILKMNEPTLITSAPYLFSRNVDNKQTWLYKRSYKHSYRVINIVTSTRNQKHCIADCQILTIFASQIHFRELFPVKHE